MNGVHQNGPAVHAGRSVRITAPFHEVVNGVGLSGARRPHECIWEYRLNYRLQAADPCPPRSPLEAATARGSVGRAVHQSNETSPASPILDTQMRIRGAHHRVLCIASLGRGARRAWVVGNPSRIQSSTVSCDKTGADAWLICEH